MFNTISMFNRRKLAISAAAFLMAAVIVPTMMSHQVSALGFVKSPMRADAAAGSGNPLIGMWEMTVQGSATYHYKYAISDGTWVAVGDVDGNFYGYRYSPTVGAYVKNGDGSYSYRERGWTYTQGGVCNGTFESTGTFVLDQSGATFSGPGAFTQFNLNGKTILAESFTVMATKVSL